MSESEGRDRREGSWNMNGMDGMGTNGWEGWDMRAGVRDSDNPDVNPES